MTGGQVDAHGGAERDAGDVGPLNPYRAEEAGHLVRVALGRVRPRRLVAFARARKVDRDTAEVLGVGRELERIAGVVGAQVRDQQQRVALPLHVVADRQPIDVDLRDGRSSWFPVATARTSLRAARMNSRIFPLLAAHVIGIDAVGKFRMPVPDVLFPMRSRHSARSRPWFESRSGRASALTS